MFVSMFSFILNKVSYVCIYVFIYIEQGVICWYLLIHLYRYLCSHLYWTRGHMLEQRVSYMFSYIEQGVICWYLCSHLHWIWGHMLLSIFSVILNKGSYVGIYVLIYIEQGVIYWYLCSYLYWTKGHMLVSMSSFILNKGSYGIYVLILLNKGICLYLFVIYIEQGIICCYLCIHLYWTRGHMLVSMFSFILNKGP